MPGNSKIAFKEWAVVVDALGQGEQVLILRKGGIREQRGQFELQHREFWLFPTQYHEAEAAIIPSKRPALRELAGQALPNSVDLQFYAVADPVLHITDLDALKQLLGLHIWTEAVLQERFSFGREPGLHALVARVYRRRSPVRLPLLPEYGGCRSWVELEKSIPADDLRPVLDDTEFNRQRDLICERLSAHALTHP